ncbi:tRNA glutamyl-Q(34) synthetase GluQRS [Roseateles saccharophilus]|uniref:Glutamyl-Q tRNA(Asp) synthetase n=1 Tax=Roseateles saccharophilus TaxID=304 RepID=A0A4R3VF22_ROSSA|nr:tRNA glutamyl-Q(34) synthetase GluQRS [Roseateles saccharophilus]MDG0833884.1 tRNA glutamyl-Q(34) synthetase GluQRS [Roseateles saccharophilus]TCV02294.1 glutamyl-Q tRNA(Asp) synthetase [Roseateles saccharophilus]
MTYRGRFAPSPTGPLHAGSLVAALASWLDARAQGGQWLVRVEDVDGPRCPPGMDQVILGQLAALGLHPDERPVWQSRRGALYQLALDRLIASGHAYGCACTRAEIAAAAGPRPRHGELVYTGTCRHGTNGRPVRAWRFRVDGRIDWTDRRLGPQTQDLAAEVGDFVLKRADGLWAYQLAVVVDDAEQGITDIVRGEDLADNTPRQIALQRALGLPTPRYLHTPLVLAADGHKLSKQNGAAALDLRDPMARLREAAERLGLQVDDSTTLLAAAVGQWRAHAWTVRAGSA